MPREFWLTTPRLALRRFTVDDLTWLRTLYADPEVMRYAGGIKGPDEVDDLFHERFLGYYDTHPGFGVWPTIDRLTAEPIGFHLLNHVRGESWVQVGFFLFPAMWRRGFASEMGRALLRYGFVDLELPTIVGIASLGNGASQRVLHKIGLRRNGERSLAHPAYAKDNPYAWFERSRDEWLGDANHD